MKYKSLLLALSVMFMVSCDEVYTRSFEGILVHSVKSEFLAEFERIVVDMGFSSHGERIGHNQDLLISEYSRHESDIGREIGIAVYLNDSRHNEDQMKVSVMVGAGGLERETKSSINRVFETIVSEVQNRFIATIQITKVSDPW